MAEKKQINKQRYRIPKDPRKQFSHSQQAKFSSGAKAFIVCIFLITLICIGFIAKKKYEQKKNFDLEKLKSASMENVELDVTYASPEEVYRSIRNKNVQLIDIREPDEFATKHIENSINIPLSKIENSIHGIDQRKKIIIIDREDSQIGKVLVDHLKNQGVDVKYLEGGILNYSQRGYILISKGNPTLTEDLVKVTSLTSDEILDMIKNGKQFVFVDVRPELVYVSDNIEGSVNFQLELLEKKKMDIPFGSILVYDDDPIRSFQAAVRLHDMNFLEVYNSLDNYETLKSKLTEAAEQARQKLQETPQE